MANIAKCGGQKTCGTIVPCRMDEPAKRTSSPPGEPLVSSRGAPPGKPRCPPAISRLRVEKIEGGLLVAGVVVAANCQIILPIFGFLFMLIGCVLTAASYRGCGANEQPDDYAARIAFTGNSRVLGPVCIVAGAIMTTAGIVLCLLMRAAQRRQRRLAFHCPIHGDFYPGSPEKSRNVGGAAGGVRGRVRSWLGLEEPEPGVPRCPRSTDPAAPPQPCPPPQPFLVPSDSVVAMGSVLGVPLSPEQTFGSIKSLAITREVASFPLSRSPTPPPIRESISEEDPKQSEELPNLVPDAAGLGGSTTCSFRVVECKLTSTDKVNAPAVFQVPKTDGVAQETKRCRPVSITICMPDEGKG